jgi:hypothetical protein
MWKKSTRARMIVFYIMGLSMKTLRNVLFVDSVNSIIEKTTMMMRTAAEIEEKAWLKRCFDIFLSFLIRSVDLQTMRSQNCYNGTKRSICRMSE